MRLGVFLLGFILPGTPCFLDLVDYFFSHVREVFSSYLFKYFLGSFLSLFSFWDPYNANVGTLNVFQNILRLSSFFFILFSTFYFTAVISITLSSRSLIHSTCDSAVDSF